MKTMHLFSSLALLLGTMHTHAQPQWRFHLAFEDATGAKDTIWFIYDTTATGDALDDHLGESFVTVDTNLFNVWMSTTLTGTTAIKTLAIPYAGFPDGYFPMEGRGYVPPLTLRWDTMLFHAPYLPSTPTSYIRYPRLCGYEIINHGIETWPGTACYSMFLSDSLVFVAPPLGSTLDLNMIFDYNDPTGTGISEHSLPSLDIFPNPAQGRIVLNAPEPLTEILLLDAVGRVVQRMAPPSIRPVEVDVSVLPAGSYLVHAIGRAGMYRGRVVVE
jgi:hypothetical protein